MKRIFVFAFTLIIIASMSLTTFAAIDTYYIKDNDSGEFYAYTMKDLLDSMNGDQVLYNHFNDTIKSGAAMHSVYDNTSKKFIKFGELLKAVNDEKNIIEFTEKYDGVQAAMPQTVLQIKVSNGKIVKNKVAVDQKQDEVIIKKTNNHLIPGSTTITIELVGVENPQNYSLKINDLEIPFKENENIHKIVVFSTDELAKMTIEEIKQALVIDGGTEETPLVVIGIE